MYEIPKISVNIVLHLAHEDSIPGRVWVTEDLISAAGNPLIEEFLNHDPDQFFSFESDAGAFRLINKQHVIFIETDQDDSEIKSLTPLTPNTMVAHFVNSQTLYGMVYPTFVEETRVSDYLNQQNDFLVLYRQEKKIIFNRTQVIYTNVN